MKKKFLFAKHAKSGENHNKFSKSVSYETLVGGTTTECSAYEQTQCLSKGSADTPLTAVGTFAPLLHNVAKVVEKLLQTSLVFRLVKVLGLVTVLSFSILSESRADEVIIVDSGTCGIGGADNCLWNIDSRGKLTVTGSGATDNYVNGRDVNGRDVYFSPWSGHQLDIVAVDIYGISTIGKGAFGYLPNLKEVYIDDTIRKLEQDAFWSSPIESLRMSDSIKTIGPSAFKGNNLTTITLPDTATIEHNSLGGNPELQIVCKGTNQSCFGLMGQMSKYSIYRDGVDSIIDLSNNVHLANYMNCNSTNYFWDGANCVREPDLSKRKCCDSCKDMGGYCNRIRYTPAEAAEVLRDGSDNTIIMTFKVNR